MKNNYAVFLPTGGLGSRLYPLTKEYPKAYLPIYFTEDNKIIRLIDPPIAFCKDNNIPLYVSMNYKKEKLKYLEEYEGLKIIHTEHNQLAPVVLEGLKVLKEDNIKYYSIFASDFLLPIEIIKKMINSIDDNIEMITLCTKNNDYSNIKLKVKDGRLNYVDGEFITDLTFHVGMVDRGVKAFEKLLTKSITDFWECLYPKSQKQEWDKVKILITDISHIDAGTPNPYYEALYKLNEKSIDSNGNIVFPGAIINHNSKNIIALPNSDSSAFALENCIVPEDVVVNSYDDVLVVEKLNKQYFNKIKIKDFI